MDFVVSWVTYVAFQVLMIWPPQGSNFWHIFGVIGFLIISCSIALNWANLRCAPNHPLTLHGEYLVKTGSHFCDALLMGPFYSWIPAILAAAIMPLFMVVPFEWLPRMVIVHVPIIPLYLTVILCVTVFALSHKLDSLDSTEVIERNGEAYSLIFYIALCVVVFSLIYRAQ